MVQTLSQELLTETTQKLVNALHPEQIILFGSHAWGTPHQNSDVDLFITMPGETEITMELKVRAYTALSGMSFSKDIVLSNHIQVERLKHVKASMTHEIISKGKILYGSVNT